MSKAAELIEMLAAERQVSVPLPELVEELRAADRAAEIAINEGGPEATAFALGQLRNIIVMLAVASVNVDAVKRSPVP